jgi:hypothetical protein
MGLNGIMTSVVIKFAGSIVKTYASSMSVVLSMLISSMIWHYEIYMNFIFRCQCIYI